MQEISSADISMEQPDACLMVACACACTLHWRQHTAAAAKTTTNLQQNLHCNECHSNTNILKTQQEQNISPHSANSFVQQLNQKLNNACNNNNSNNNSSSSSNNNNNTRLTRTHKRHYICPKNKFNKLKLNIFLLTILCAIFAPDYSAASPRRLFGRALVLKHRHHLHSRSLNEPKANMEHIDVDEDIRKLAKTVNNSIQAQKQRHELYAKNEYDIESKEALDLIYDPHKLGLQHPLQDHDLNEPLNAADKDEVIEKLKQSKETLEIIMGVYDEIIKEREEKDEELRFLKNYNNELKEKVDKFFTNSKPDVHYVLTEIQRLLNKMGVNLPTQMHKLIYDTKLQPKGHALSNEHIRVLEIIYAFLEKLMENSEKHAHIPDEQTDQM